MSVLTKFH